MESKRMICLTVGLIIATAGVNLFSSYSSIQTILPSIHAVAPLEGKPTQQQANNKTVDHSLPPTGGVVHYATTEVSGWNNQRQGCFVAWIIAYYTGHALEYKTFHPAYTGSTQDNGGYDHSDLWDVSLLQRYVQIKNVSHTKLATNYELQIGLGTVFPNVSQVQALHKYRSITYGRGWNFFQHTFPWIDPWKDPAGSEVFQRLMESFTYSPLIQRVAAHIVKKIGGPFVGIHARKDRLPALRCSDYNLKVFNDNTTTKKKAYERGACLGITWTNLIETVFTNNTLPVYLAHDRESRQGSAFLNFEPVLESFDFYVFFDLLRPAIVSAIEQEIMIRAEYFVASLHSSWSEYVIYKRALVKEDGKKNYDIWKSNTEFWI